MSEQSPDAVKQGGAGKAGDASAGSDTNDASVGSVERRYDEALNFNAVTSWLHSLRYKGILDVFSGFASGRAERIRVVDIGCANAKLYPLLDRRFAIDYLGIDPNPVFVDIARERYGAKQNFRIVHESAVTAVEALDTPDIIIALETLEHIPESQVVRLVESIASKRPSLFVCSVPVEIGPSIWLKNLGSALLGYGRHREYTWPETFWAGLYRLDRLPPHGVGHKGFDHRWLAQTIRHNMRIRELRKFPVPFLPAAVSTSVFMVAEPR